MAAGTRLVVLSKPPRPGHCKSRLAARLGHGPAARLARAFLADTWASVSAWVSSQPEIDLVFALSEAADEYPLLLPIATTARQGQGDLGRRMATLAAGALGQRGRVLLLGSDSPGLPVTHLAAAVAALEGADVVLGPNVDGGFWCLGVRGGAAALWGNTWLDELDWSTDATAAQVETRVRRLGLRCARAPEWFDVDRAEDLPRLEELLRADPERAPETARELRRQAEPGARPTISAVIATLEEGVRLDECLDALARQPGELEVIVADGGSRDHGAERAAGRPGVTVVVTGPGRGRQFAAGARMATGDVLVFLHTDTRLPERGTELMRAALADGSAEAGAFVTRTVADRRFPDRAGPLLRLADLRSRFTRHPYGDQALFVTRTAYEAVGGFRPLPIMEDYDLSRRLAARRPLARVGVPVQVSGRRMQTRPLRAMLLMRLIPPLFRLGVNPDLLARLYRRA